MFKILKYGLISDVATCSAKVAPAPEMAPPVSFAQFGKLHLHSVGRTSFDTTHKVTDGNVGRDGDEHVDMLFGQNARYDLNTKLVADLLDDRSYPLAQRPLQHLVAILRDPDDVIAMVKNRVTSGCGRVGSRRGSGFE